MHPIPRSSAPETPFLPVGGRTFTPERCLFENDDIRFALAGVPRAIKARTIGIVFLQDPDNKNGQIAFCDTDGVVKPPFDD